MSALSSGWWCATCEFFELEDPQGGTRCPACGCPPEEHIPAQVVEA